MNYSHSTEVRLRAQARVRRVERGRRLLIDGSIGALIGGGLSAMAYGTIGAVVMLLGYYTFDAMKPVPILGFVMGLLLGAWIAFRRLTPRSAAVLGLLLPAVIYSLGNLLTWLFTPQSFAVSAPLIINSIFMGALVWVLPGPFAGWLIGLTLHRLRSDGVASVG